MKIKKIGNIDLTSSLWWDEYDNTPTVISEVSQTIDGGVIVWEQSAQDNAKNITLSGETDGWQTTAIKDAIKNLVETSLGATTTITTIEDDVINVRFRHEINGACVFARVAGAYECDYYTCTINLARV